MLLRLPTLPLRMTVTSNRTISRDAVPEPFGLIKLFHPFRPSILKDFFLNHGSLLILTLLSVESLQQHGHIATVYRTFM